MFCSRKMSNFEDMNVEAQLQAAYAMNAQLRDQIDSLNRTVWSLEERLRISDGGKEDLKRFYENQMEALRSDQQRLIDEAVSRITKTFEEQIAKLIEERDAALRSAKSWRGRNFGRKSERDAGRNRDDDDPSGRGENRESEKEGYVDAESQKAKDARASGAGSTVDAERLVKRLKRRHPGAEVTVERVDYGKASQYMSDENVVYHRLEEYFTLSDGEYFRTGKNGEVEKSWYRIMVRYPERYEEHLYETAHVRSRTEDEYKTTDVLEARRPVAGCMFGADMLSNILCEKYLYHTPLEQVVQKLNHGGVNISSSVLGEHVHNAIEWLSSKLEECWRAEVRKSWILMLDETRVLVGCADKETRGRHYKNRYMWGIRANSVNLVWFLYESGSRGAAAIRPFLDGFLGFYTTDGYVVYKIFDSKEAAEVAELDGASKKGRRSACLVHIRRGFVEAIMENEAEAMWFIDEFGRMFSVDHYCAANGLTGAARLAERLKPGNTVDIMRRIEGRLEVFRKSNFAGCGELLKKALKYTIGEWPAMRRVLESGDVELSNNLSEQMMRRIKMNLKNAGNIGSERSARHNAFMYSVIESCKMVRRNVEDYLKLLLERLRKARAGDDLTCCLPCYLAL